VFEKVGRKVGDFRKYNTGDESDQSTLYLPMEIS
jgi:hypothetical protein